jgi:hypothetical protein
MPAPLPPVVDGPIYPVTTQVHVENLLPAAEVTVYENGTQIGTATASSASDLWVTLTAAPTQGRQITAAQTYPSSAPAIPGVVAGVASDQSTVGVPVLPLPNPLPSPVFNGWITSCTDLILMSGLLPGCTLQISQGTSATPLIKAQVGQPTQWFDLPASPALVPGTVLRAQLLAAGHPSSPVTTSLPVADPGPLMAPKLSDPPLMGCETSITLSNLTPGADLRIINGGNTEIAGSPWDAMTLIDLLPLKVGVNALTAQLYYARCKRIEEGPKSTFDVLPANPGAPHTGYPLCVDVRQLTVNDLHGGEILTVSRMVQGHAPQVVGVQGVSGSTATVDLPSSFQPTDPAGPVSLELSATLCGVASPTTTLPYPATPGGPYPPPKVRAPLYDCARTVQLEGVHPGSLIQVFSDPSGLPRSNAVVVTTADPMIGLWSPLITGEQIFVRVHGCNAQGPSPRVTVQPVPTPFQAPAITTPVFGGATEVELTGVYPGAQVYLFVNGALRSHLDTNALAGFGPSIVLAVDGQPLAVGDKLTATQTLCSAISVTKEGGQGTVIVTQLYVRREVWRLEGSDTFDPITLAYAKAVQTMQARPITDPTSWSYQAAMHGTYTAPPSGAVWNQCQHSSWFFFPWHRMYLYYFERIVRAAVTAAGGPADFALMYWNYNLPSPGNTIPPAFQTSPTLPDGTANPLYLAAPLRDANYMSGAAFDSSLTSPAVGLADTNFTAPAGSPSFGGPNNGPIQFGTGPGDIELTPHNVMHGAIGGTASAPTPCAAALMSDVLCSAADPIFFLHHANIDHLWNVWIASGGGRVDPPDASWNNANFDFFDETATKITMSAAQVLDTASQLDYIYDDEPVPLLRRRRLQETITTKPQASRPPELVAASEAILILTGAPASVELVVPVRARSLAEAIERGAAPVLVRVDDIRAERNPGVPYGVYLNLPPEADVDLRRQYHIGNVGLFGIEHMNDPDRPQDCAPGFPHVFDATDVVAMLRSEGRWDHSKVTVTFQVIGPLPPPDQEGSWEPIPTPQPTPVEIGRVGLFVG